MWNRRRGPWLMTFSGGDQAAVIGIPLVRARSSSCGRAEISPNIACLDPAHLAREVVAAGQVRGVLVGRAERSAAGACPPLSLGRSHSVVGSRGRAGAAASDWALVFVFPGRTL